MIHYTNPVPATPPRDLRASHIPFQQINPSISMDEYRKVLSPFHGVPYQEPSSAIKTRERASSRASAKEQVRQTLQQRFRRVFESPAGKKGGCELTPHAGPSASMIQSQPHVTARAEERRAPSTPRAQEEPRGRAAEPLRPAEKRAQSKAECGYRQLPKEFYQPQPKSRTKVSDRPYCPPAAATTKESKMPVPSREEEAPKAIPESIPAAEKKRTETMVPAAPQEPGMFPPAGSEEGAKSPLSECSKCSGARAKGMEYVCVQCENQEIDTERKQRERAQLAEDRKVDDSLQKTVEELRKRKTDELVAFRQRTNCEMKVALQEVEGRKIREAEERYPQSYNRRTIANSHIRQQFCARSSEWITHDTGQQTRRRAWRS